MGEKDISEKILMDYNDVFADIINVCAFKGKEMVEPKELANTSVHSPIASFVLYFGTKTRWCKKKSIKEIVKIPEVLDEYVNDYKLNVIEVAWLSEKQLKQFKSDFGIVANFFVQKRKNKNYIPDDNREIQHVDAVLKLLSVMTGDRDYENILYNGVNGKAEVKTMCEVADRLKTMGKNEGTDEERLRIIRKKMEKGMNAQEIADLMELPVAEVKNFMKICNYSEQVKTHAVLTVRT